MTIFDPTIAHDQINAAADAIQARDEALSVVLIENDSLKSQIADLRQQVADLTPLKPAIRGLITTDPDYLSKIPYAEFGSFKARWADIEKAPGIFDFSAVDAILEAHPDVKFRARFRAGADSPDFVKTRSGGAVYHVPDGPNGAPGYVPRFWTTTYLNDYLAFMRAVAARYEGHPQIVEVTNSATTTIFAEPFILGADAATIDRYWQAGYRKALVETNLRDSIHGMMALFPKTRISLAGHTRWQHIVQGPNGPGDGKLATSWEMERTILNDLSATYGERLVLEDHGLGPDDAMPPGQPRETATSWYAYMAGLLLNDQSYGWQFTLNGGDMNAAADLGIEGGACFLEYAAFEQIPEPRRREVHDALLDNAADKP